MVHFAPWNINQVTYFHSFNFWLSVMLHDFQWFNKEIWWRKLTSNLTKKETDGYCVKHTSGSTANLTAVKYTNFKTPVWKWSALLWCYLLCSYLPGASVRNSAHGKGHEEGGLAYAKAWSSLRKPPVPEHLTPNPESVSCSHLHLWPYGGLSPITVSLREGVNVQLQGNKNSWAWQECFSLRTPLKVI